MSYSGERCFTEEDIDEVRNWALDNFGAKGEILTIAIEERLGQEATVWEDEVYERENYLRDEFTDEELENFAVVQLNSFESIYNSVSLG